MEKFDIRVPIVWMLVVFALLVLRAVATFDPSVWLWGLDSLADRPPVWTLALIPFALPFLKRPTLAIGRAVTRLFHRSTGVTLACAGAMGALFVLFRSRNFLLGDSLLYVHALREGIQIASAGTREAGATIVVSALHWSLRKTALADSQTTFVIASVTAGVVYVILSMAVARLLARTVQGRGLIFASLIALGGLQIFFGHAEYYSLVAASGMLFIYLSLRWAKGRGNLVLPALAFALALFVHMMNAILIFAFLWLIVCALRCGRRVQAVAAALLVPAILLVAGILIHYPLDSLTAIFARGKHMLPLINTDPDYYAYGILDVTHLSEVANELLLTATCLPLLAIGGLWAARRRGREHVGEDGGGGADGGAGEGSSLAAAEQVCPWAIGGFLLCAAGGAAIFSLTANPALGMARDWDIFAFPFMVMTLAAATAAGALGDPRRILWLCGAVTLIGGMHLALFVANNRAPSSYVPRFKRIALQADLFTPTPRAELWRYLAWEEIKAGDIKEAKEDLLYSIRDFYTQVKAYKMLAVLEIGEQFDWLASPAGKERREALDIDSEEKMMAEAARLGLNHYYGTVVETSPYKVKALIGAGIAAINVGAPDSLIVDAFKRAVQADPEDLEGRAFWGDILRIHGRYDQAEEQYDWVLSKRRWQIRAFIGRACLLGVRGEPEMAFILVKELREHYRWSVEAQQFLNDWHDGKLKTEDDFRTFLVAQ